MKTNALLIAAALALAGCTSTGGFTFSDRQSLKNEQGNVIGYQELVRNNESGETFKQVSLFRPVNDNAGRVIGYEEETRDGAIVRNLQGRQIGNRFADLRSRDTNMRSRGITFLMRDDASD